MPVSGKSNTPRFLWGQVEPCTVRTQKEGSYVEETDNDRRTRHRDQEEVHETWGGEDSPWYPPMRLFQPSQPGAGGVAAELQKPESWLISGP
jgi:hypothetical protein